MIRKPIVWIAAGVALVAAIGLFLAWRAHQTRTPAAAETATLAPASAPPAIANPVPEAPPAQPLPSLADSDVPLHDALASVIGKQNVDSVFRPELLLRHLVVTIDNLSRKRVAIDLRPTKALPGQFIAKGDEQRSTIDPANYQRYAPYVKVVQMMDSKQLAATYFHFYPLFQQAYQDLGYPNGYFNDRLVETIDNLLATPAVDGDIVLVRPNVMYQFQDPNLEALSAGQKLMLRMGTANAEIVKAKLREVRAEVATRTRSSDRSRTNSPGG